MTHQRKKNNRLLISLVVLIGIAVLIGWLGKTPARNVYSNTFTVPELAAADRFVMQGSSVATLEFDGVRWVVNGMPADRNLVEVLFSTLAQLRVRQPVAAAWQDSLARMLRERGQKVSIFQGQQQLISFYAGGNAPRTKAWLMREEDDVPYEVIIPGYRVYVSGIFELSPLGWRDKYVFNFNWRNFKSLQAEFTSPKESAFTVANDGKQFSIIDLPTDTAKLNSFLDELSLLTVDEYVEDASVSDSLTKAVPHAVFRISTLSNEEYSLALFSPDQQQQQVMGLVQGAQAVRFDPRKVKNLYRLREWFRLASR